MVLLVPLQTRDDMELIRSRYFVWSVLVTLALQAIGEVARAQTSTTYAPILSPPASQCCALGLMDDNGQVAIETARVLPTGTFQALQVRLCTTNPVAVQIWTQLGATQFQLKWQTIFSGSVAQKNQAFTLIDLSGNSVTIAPGDRLGIYSPSNGSMKIPVPYDTDLMSGSLFFSLNQFPANQLTVGQQITLEDVKWPRTFANYLTFCPSTSACPSLEEDVLTVGLASGPPGQCCAPSVAPSCDANGAIGSSVTSQANQINQLEEQINQLQVIVSNLLNSNVSTGICPAGFISGVYGVGSCYKVHRDQSIQMAEAVIQCRDLYSAGLLQINSALEDSFIKSFLLNNTNPAPLEYYWTAGMYNIPLRNWYWYDQNLRYKAPFTYRNWYNGMEPAPLTVYDVCSVYTINYQQDVDYWLKNDCTLNNYYICEVPKQCL